MRVREDVALPRDDQHHLAPGELGDEVKGAAFNIPMPHQVTNPHTGEVIHFHDFEEAMMAAIAFSHEVQQDIPVVHVACVPERGIHLIPHVGCTEASK